jgi:hypothetical protein
MGAAPLTSQASLLSHRSLLPSLQHPAEVLMTTALDGAAPAACGVHALRWEVLVRGERRHERRSKRTTGGGTGGGAPLFLRCARGGVHGGAPRARTRRWRPWRSSTTPARGSGGGRGGASSRRLRWRAPDGRVREEEQQSWRKEEEQHHG